MKTPIIDAAWGFAHEKFREPIFEKLPFHNLVHTEQVVDAVQTLSEASNFGDEDIENLMIAAVFHDLGYSVTYDGHEDASIEIARPFLENQPLSPDRVALILRLIEVTKIEVKGATELEKVMKDADLVGLSSADYVERGEFLRTEWATFKSTSYSDTEWNRFNYESIAQLEYVSEEGKKKFGKKRKKNLKALKKQIKKDKLVIDNTIATSKSAQTMFKTTLRNEIGLSAIADNKANMMLSVNALIITIAFPLLANNIKAHPELMFPSAVLLLVSVGSMIFATLATRPIDMNGITNIDDIDKLKTNLFFFGNFHKMTFDQYLLGIEKVVASDEVLDNSIIRDHFFLGKSLGKKYQYLRTCYNIFMYGLVITVLVFLGVTLIP